jgi:hypothetical protein
MILSTEEKMMWSSGARRCRSAVKEASLRTSPTWPETLGEAREERAASMVDCEEEMMVTRAPRSRSASAAP